MIALQNLKTFIRVNFTKPKFHIWFLDRNLTILAIQTTKPVLFPPKNQSILTSSLTITMIHICAICT